MRQQTSESAGLSRKKLRENGIEFDEDIEENANEYFEKSHSVQAWIVTEGLLDFDGIISSSNYCQLPSEDSDFVLESHKFRRPNSNEQRSFRAMETYNKQFNVFAHDARFKLAQSIAESARNVKAAKETRWSPIVKSEIFGKLVESARQAEGMGGFNPLQIVESEDEDTWRRGHRALRRTTPHAAPCLTQPKVDLYIALPMVSRSSNPRGFHRDDYIQNFTVDSLSQSEQTSNGRLISNPMKNLDSIGLKSLKEKHLVCFPSTIVELKHHDVKDTIQCYCQAANGTAVALSMISRAARYAVPTDSFGEIRPVVAFTFIGHRSKVWIAFVSGRGVAWMKRKTDGKKLKRKNLCEYTMKCIWEGDLRSVWDNVQLCRIIENLQYWIIRHFRPWISSCIDTWRLHGVAMSCNPRCEEAQFDSASEEGWSSDDEGNDSQYEECSETSKDGSEEDSSDATHSRSDDEDSEVESGESDSEDTYDTLRTRLRKLINLTDQTISDLEILSHPRIQLEAAEESDDGSDCTSEASIPPPRRRRDAATLSPEAASKRRTPLQHGETSPLPIRKKRPNRHNRSRSVN